MTEQMEFPFIHDAKRREQLLLEVEFGKRRNSVLLAALLREIAKFPPGGCYPSQATLARAFKVSEQTIYRALKSLGELDLVVTQLKGRYFADGSKTVNHYFVNWTALEQRVRAHQGDDSGESLPRPIRQPDVGSTDPTVSPTDPTVRGDRSDSCEIPFRQLGPTDPTSGCRTIEIEKQIDKTTTTDAGPSVVVVVDREEFVEEVSQLSVTADPSWTPAECKRIYEELVSFPVLKAEEAIATCKKWQWSVADVEAHIAHAKDGNISGAYLANWLTKEGSAPPHVLRARAEAQRSIRERADALAAIRASARADGNGASDWHVAAVTATRFAKQHWPWVADEQDLTCRALLERATALKKLAKEAQDKTLGTAVDRLLFAAGDMPAETVDAELTQLEAAQIQTAEVAT